MNVIIEKDNNNNGPPKKLARWLFDNQTGLSFNLITLLFLIHICVSKARPWTSKFFTLSYYNPNTGKYAAGYDDFYFMAFCIVLLTGLRAGFMKYVLAPLAKRWGLSKRKEVSRFSEQAWMLMYYNVLWPLGMYIYYTSPYFLNMKELWTDWPQRELDGLMKAYILGQWSFWLQQVLVINIEDRRKDHWQMLTHHFITIALIAASYAYHQTRVANLIMVLTDIVDLVFPLGKCLKYLGHTTICNILFGVFIIVWLLSRHVFYLMTCWSVYSDLPRLIPPACYRGPADNLQGPFPVPSSGWSHLLDPFRDPAGTVCFNDNISFGFLSYLLMLQVMMVIWSVFIIRVAMRVLKGSSAEDIRSDGEGEGEEEVGYDDAAQAIDLKKKKKKKRAAGSSSGANRQLFLNRIGEKQAID